MTLNIAKFISNSIKTQAKIQHLDINVKTVIPKNIPQSVSNTILSEYGEKYLLDANYVVFFWGIINNKIIDKLFNVVDKALGKSANKLTNKDFKKINIENQLVDNNTTNDNISEPSDEQSLDDIDNNDISDSLDDDLNENDESLDNTKQSYFFLKITTK